MLRGGRKMCDSCDCYKYYPLLRLTAKHFVAGIILRQPRRPNKTAPILTYMARWSADDIRYYCLKRGIKVEIL